MSKEARRLSGFKRGAGDPMRPEDIRLVRTRFGMTQETLASLLGYSSKSRIAELEAGTRKPSRAVLRLLQAYLGGYRPKDWPPYILNGKKYNIVVRYSDED